MLIGRIDGATRSLGKPEGWPEDKPCQVLHIRDIEINNGDNVMASAWVPTPDEAKALGEGAHIHLWVWGKGHPPVAITVADVKATRGNAFFEKRCGALTSDIEIPGISQELSDLNAKFYGGKHFIAEGLVERAAEYFAGLLGLKFVIKP